MATQTLKYFDKLIIILYRKGKVLNMKAAITGGAGRQCLATILDFVENNDVEKILLIDANDTALNLRREFINSEKIETMVIDITDTSKLATALMDYDVCLNASSHVFNMVVMDACLESKTNYTDLGGLFHWARKQLTRHEDFKKAGITGIVGSGSAPGIVNVLAKYGADKLDTIDSILILDGIVNMAVKGYKFVPPYALSTIIDEFAENNFEFKNGEWEELPPFSGKMTVDFPEPFGSLNLYNMIHSEVATMPLSFKDKGIKNVSFKLALPTLFEERLRFLVENKMGNKEPITVKGVQVSPRDFIVELLEVKPGSNHINIKHDDHKILRVIIKGTKEGRAITYEMETILHHYPKWDMGNGPFTVGFPAAITSRMLGNGQIKEKGFFSGETVIDPAIYFAELKQREIQVTAKVIEEL